MITSVDSIISEAIDEVSDDLRRMSLSIHSNPELAMKEVAACKLLTDYLENAGYGVERGAGGLVTSFVATFESSAEDGDGLRIGFCSEYDALPGIGHGCGHNLIAISGVAMLVGVRRVMEQCKIPGTVKLFGTPSEEALGGKITMLDRGVFANMDLLMMMHPTAGYSGSWHSQCCLSMKVEYFGRASHAALAPWDGVNAGSAAIVAMQTLSVLREQLKPDWRTHGIITTGGQAANVIPQHAAIDYTVRTGVAEDLEVLRARVLRVFESAAWATGCTHKVVEERAYLDNRDNPVLGHMFEDIMRAQYGGKPAGESGGSTDFGNLSQQFISLHAMYDLDGSGAPNHTIEFTEGAASEDAHRRTLFAAKAMACIASKCLVDSGFWDKVRKAHNERQER
ncbi:hypothetical protein IW140_001315 [Coemansia sp. RSA 1813]|nr:hypothetical protein EV178_001098 [Coemansia sp. RSA 1646]KAJ1770345.1 hypothetical protein LPJ74_003296 [Coemansia sp. RSA 1843]KAJ2091639.1 hypothetical protein IW138_001621 [Coemansia sp. RSA 986]KAJ2216959.1 hypothetical protein EV179_000994 [Coemansia sp. RSA 487]KAJ2571965.1 hypothetical protein IW140_001315 [Coemansia sp. RSA 1813]